jgi:CheY-like chemotaxis protein
VDPDRRLMPSSDSALPGREHPVILVIDDEQAILDMLEEILQDEGYTVLLVGNGQAGLEQAINAQPDLILTDLMMPVMDGRTFSRHLRAEPRTARIPLIAMSAAYRPHDGDAFDAVLAKPFNIDDVLTLIHAQLDGSS